MKLDEIESLRQQLAAAYEAGKRDASEDLEQAAFEKWLYDKCPSGDVESVQRQWLKSYEYAEFADKLEQAAQIEQMRQQLTAAQEREQTNDTLLEQQGDKLAALNDLVAELRQQLADRDEQISDLTISSDTYFAERNSARDVWRRASKDRDELRQQLAESNRRIEYEQLCASELEQQLSAKQAEVDALMLEYCPSEMSQEQLDNWAAHQRPAKEQGK